MEIYEVIQDWAEVDPYNNEEKCGTTSIVYFADKELANNFVKKWKDKYTIEGYLYKAKIRIQKHELYFTDYYPKNVDIKNLLFGEPKK